MIAADWPLPTDYDWHDRPSARIKRLRSYEPYSVLRAYLYGFPAAARVAWFRSLGDGASHHRRPCARRGGRIWLGVARYCWESGVAIGMLDLIDAFRPRFPRSDEPMGG
jgi:hypothetical protein